MIINKPKFATKNVMPLLIFLISTFSIGNLLISWFVIIPYHEDPNKFEINNHQFTDNDVQKVNVQGSTDGLHLGSIDALSDGHSSGSNSKGKTLSKSHDNLKSNDAKSDNTSKHEQKSKDKTSIENKATNGKKNHVGKEGEVDCQCPHTCDWVKREYSGAGVRCGDRLTFVMNKHKKSEMEACRELTQGERMFCPNECNPDKCKDMKPNFENNDLDEPDEAFHRYEGVAIVTKVHSSDMLGSLKLNFCLLNAAYNRFVNYDIVVFTTMPWTEAEIEELQEVVPDSKLVVAIDGPTLQEHLADMTEDELIEIRERCDVKPDENLTWFHHCSEDREVTNVAYSWQAQFRSYYIWTHPALKQYKYMIWNDSDSLATQTWKRDPMKAMVDNDLTIMFDHYPAGKSRKFVEQELKKMMLSAYNRTFCRAALDDEDGVLKGVKCNRESDMPTIGQIHGFHHITNLDVYREPKHQDFLRQMTSVKKFSRVWDDQLAVTIPGIFGEPGKAWDHRLHNFTLMLRHNGKYDGHDFYSTRKYKNWWMKEDSGARNWTAGRVMCEKLIMTSRAGKW